MGFSYGRRRCRCSEGREGKKDSGREEVIDEGPVGFLSYDIVMSC